MNKEEAKKIIKEDLEKFQGTWNHMDKLKKAIKVLIEEEE